MISRKLIVLALLTSLFIPVAAQRKAAGENVTWGLRAGWTVAPLEWGGTAMKLSYTLGVASDVRISRLPISIETGLYYTNRYVSRYDNWSLLLPVLFRYEIRQGSGLSVQPFAGPFVAYSLDDQDWDVGLRLGVGFAKRHFYGNIGYDLSGNYGVDEDAFFITVGYNF